MRKLITRGFLYIYIIIVGLHYFTCAGNGLRLRHVVSSASRRRRPDRRKSSRVITLLVVLPYRRVRLPWGLRIAERALPHRAFGAHAIFLLLLTLHKLFIMQHFFIYYYYYYLRFALFFVHR